MLKEEFDEERERFSERIAQLEDALSLANLEITRLTIEMSDMTNSERRMSGDSRSSLELLFTDKVCGLNIDAGHSRPKNLIFFFFFCHLVEKSGGR